MNAMQNAALAPLDFVRLIVGRPGPLENATHRQTLHLHLQ